MTDELKPCPFKFGDIISNGWASDDNPTKTGFFVRTVRSRGKLNPGIHVELTDGKGKMWQTPWRHGHKLTRTPTPATPQGAPETLPEVLAIHPNALKVSFEGRGVLTPPAEILETGVPLPEYTLKATSDARIADLEGALTMMKQSMTHKYLVRHAATARNEALEEIVIHFKLFETLESEGVVIALQQYISDLGKDA